MGGIFSGLGASLGRSWAAFWASWDCLGRPQERKNADGPMRKPLFSKIAFFVSWGPRWLSWAPLGASWAGLGAKRAPKMVSKAVPKWVPILVKKWTRHLSVFGPILGPFEGPKQGCPGDSFSGCPGPANAINSIIWAPSGGQKY